MNILQGLLSSLVDGTISVLAYLLGQLIGLATSYLPYILIGCLLVFLLAFGFRGGRGKGDGLSTGAEEESR